MKRKPDGSERLPGQTLLIISAAVVLFGFWLLLSGYFTPFLLAAGAGSVAAVIYVARRMGTVDQEGQPTYLLGRALAYWPWLLWEIAKSCWSVSRIIVSPSLPISPNLLRVKTSQRTALGQVIYANSITLTPGTISVELIRDEILVHALTRETAEGLESGEMDRRATRFEAAL